MAEKKDTAPGGVPVQVTVALQGSSKGEAPPQAVAYAFTDTGHFLASAPVDAKGLATLTIPASQSPREIRVVAGPDHGAETNVDRSPALSDLTRRGAQEQYLRTGPDAKALQAVFNVPSEIWRCWFRFCFVKGTLQKRIYSSGVAIDYPVCGANVQIWEVEQIFLIVSKLADVQLEKIRQYMLNPQPLPPGPGPERFSFNDVAFNPQPDPPGDPFRRLGRIEVARPISTIQEYSVASPEFESVHRAALSGDLATLRQSLTTVNEAAIRYIFCLLFPGFITKRLIATLTTDRCGHFQGNIFLSCHETANLYFTASANFIFGIQIPIYEPAPVSCYTHWNYQCGTEVTLYTSSPFAPLCTPCAPIDAPENYVLFRALGNVQLNGIYGASPVVSGATTAANIGQAANLYGGGYDSPFGGNILPRVEFDSSLRALNKAMYYQISYRQGTSGAFAPLVGSIDRKYNHFVGTDLVTSVYNLGPKVVNAVANLFEIPPALPPQGDWAFPNPPVDHANAQFTTTALPPSPPPPPEGTHGKYQLKLDLFDSNGNAVNIAAAGIRYFVPTTQDPDGTIHTSDAATIGLVTGNSFIMTVHIDNRMTSGSLGTPALDGNPADTCGVFRYSRYFTLPVGSVTIPYTATHPGDFATYSYRLSRGAIPLTPPTTSGKVSAATNPASVTMSVVSLLTQPDNTLCDTAGFAEDLYVAALATDGWGRLSQYDSSPPPRAFVLAPLP
ncbi:MAG: hypothetical protein ABI833_17260 [Acidobacteriota bacterium]